MRREEQVRALRTLRARLERGERPTPMHEEVSAAVYRCPKRFERERERVFRRSPIVVAHASELESPGSYVTAAVAGIPLVAVNDGDATRVFVNACRHRGARLVEGPSGKARRTFTCRYHGWCYGFDGALRGVPLRESFAGLDLQTRGLRPVPSAVAHGFVFVQLDGELDLDAFLPTPLRDDLRAFELESHVVHRRSEVVRECNWKLIVEAFAEGYHATHLHRDSVARFFLDTALFEAWGAHTRQVGARKSIHPLPEIPDESWDVRAHTTVFYTLFPSTMLVFHPEYVSQMDVTPLSPGRTRFVHRMLVPRRERSAEAEHRLDRSFALIDQKVFAEEDLGIAENVQSALSGGLNDTFVLGAEERGVIAFHRALDEALAREGES